MNHLLARILSVALILALVLGLAPAQVQPASALSPNLVISQVYGGGGNSGAVYRNDFVELFNRGSAPVSLAGWSIQYTSASGTGSFGSATNLLTELPAVTLQPGQYFLVQEAQGSGGTTGLPTPDATDATPINMSGTGGKVVLVSTNTALGCNGSSTPCTPTQLALIVDLVGWDGANFFEGTAAAPATTNTTTVLRNSNGCAETDQNAADFAASAPTPRNTASPINLCGAPADSAPSVSSVVPANGMANVALNADIVVTFSEPVNVSDGWYTLSCAVSGGHTAAVSGGFDTFMLNPDADFAGNESCTLTIQAALVVDQDSNDPPDTMAADYTTSFTTVVPPVAIHTVQGAAHLSPLNGQTVTLLPAIVTALRTTGSTRGFYLQDPNPDADLATSEGVFVFTGSTSNPAALVSVGDLVQVSGKVSEYRSGGASSVSLAVTELVAPYTVNRISSGNPLPAPMVIGAGGLFPPTTVIEDDAAAGDAETTGIFDPASDGLDFYESLEGMLVQVNDALATGPMKDFTSNREISVVGDNGANASLLTTHGGIVVQAGDFNPERIILNDWIAGGPVLPAVNVGARFPGAIVGVMDYSFNNFKLEVISLPAVVDSPLAQEITEAAATAELSVATFNVENLAPTDPQAKFDELASLIIHNLQAPDVLAIEEIQDNSGITDDGAVDAAATWNMLIAAIQAAGGPVYEYRQINPVNDQDGGATGGNIRVGFLFRTDRGLSFVDRPGADSTTANAVVSGASGPELAYSPGRIDPTNTAFNSSRKPLAGEFVFRRHKVFIIANHFNSKGGDQPLYGRYQPAELVSEAQRVQQATVVRDFVQSLLALDANANVVVLGDLNDFEFSNPLLILKGAPLHALIETLPQPERYTYVYDGNSQAIDHILVSGSLFAQPFAYDVVHVNSEFAVQASDHDPQVVHLALNDPPVANAGGPYVLDEGSSVTLAATATDPEGSALTYAWDLDNDGSFETPGQSVTFTAGDGPGTPIVKVQVTDEGGLSAIAEATLTVNNVAPTATFNAPASVNEGDPLTLSLSNPVDASSADTAAGFTYAFDCGAGYTAVSSTSSATCSALDNPGQAVRGKVLDKDGGETEYTATIVVGNVAPVVAAITAPTAPVLVNTTINVTANFADVGVQDTHTASWDWGDGSITAGVVTEINGAGSVSGSHAYTAAGVYAITLTVTDMDGSTATVSYSSVVVVDPSAGFVTAGGWINSAAGAYVPDPSVGGKAVFAVVAKYLKGSTEPKGVLDFLFPAARMNFRSTAYDWLVVNQGIAILRGEGKLNGQGGYQFMAWITDGKPDTLRIKIWRFDGNGAEVVVYDNGTAQPIQGSIVIHK